MKPKLKLPKNEVRWVICDGDGDIFGASLAKTRKSAWGAFHNSYDGFSLVWLGMGYHAVKGEVRSSILRGSTMFYAVFMALGNLLPTSNVDTTGAKCSA